LKSPDDEDDKQRVAVCVVYWMLFGVKTASLDMDKQIPETISEAAEVTGWTASSSNITTLRWEVEKKKGHSAYRKSNCRAIAWRFYLTEK